MFFVESLKILLCSFPEILFCSHLFKFLEQFNLKNWRCYFGKIQLSTVLWLHKLWYHSLVVKVSIDLNRAQISRFRTMEFTVRKCECESWRNIAFEYIKRIVWALKMWVGGHIGQFYTPLQKNGIKKIQNKSMETTVDM